MSIGKTFQPIKDAGKPALPQHAETDSGVTTTSTFRDLGGSRTELRIHQVRVPAEYRSPEAQAGFQTSLDRFAQYLASLA